MPRYTAQQFINAIPGTGGVISLLAEVVGCKWHTAKRYINKHPTVRQAWENENSKVSDRAKHNIVKAIHGGDLQMSKWWLQVKDPEFKPKSELGISGKGRDGALLIRVIYGDDGTNDTTPETT